MPLSRRLSRCASFLMATVAASASGQAVAAGPAGPVPEPAYVFPIEQPVDYGPDHHDYPATDIFAPVGAEVYAVGPATLVPRGLEDFGVNVCHDLDEILPEIDVFNMLRIQLERQESGLFPSIRECSRLFGLNEERLTRAKPEALVLHPGPVDRGVELTSGVADGPRSVILDQVTNGLAVRMAVLYLISSGGAGVSSAD